jgi:hypothetical protein
MATAYTNRKAININPGDIIVAPMGPMVVRHVARTGKWIDMAGRDIASGKQIRAGFRTDETVAVLGKE